ncbi:MAG: chaperone modulator CbpM [Pseudomonadota bacterium]|nr:chaperone modulator CbpM [Pseudomonadota bacterium]
MMTENEVLQRIGRLDRERLQLCIRHTWVRPLLSAQGHVFDETDLARLTLITELTEDLGVNDEALPLILNLLDEVNTLRRHMRAVDQALGEQGTEVCAAVLERLRNGPGED